MLGGWAGGVLQLPVPMTHQHASAPGHHTLSPQTHLPSLVHGAQRGGKHLGRCCLPSCRTHRHKMPARESSQLAQPCPASGEKPRALPGSLTEQGPGLHVEWEVPQGAYRIPMFLHSTRNDLLKAQYPGLKHVCPCPSH